MWVVADLDDDYIAKMEDVLEVYERPYNPQQPVIRREADHPARRRAARQSLRCRGGKHGGITNMSVAGLPTCSAQ
jgi:4'-phosphopantetheinyl transferase EntD